MPEAAQPAASAPAAPPKDFGEYRLSLKAGAETKSATPSDGATADAGEKPAPGAEPDDSQKGTSDSDKSERQAKNQDRREKRWYEERGEMRARMRQMEAELTALRTGDKGEAKPKAAASGSAVKLADFVGKIGKEYPNYEAAHEAYEEAKDGEREAKLRSQIEAERSDTERKQTREKATQNFQKRLKDYRKDNPEFSTAFDEVSELLDSKSRPASDAIARAEHPGHIIAHLYENQDELEAILDMSADDARLEVRMLDRGFRKKAPSTETTEVADGGTKAKASESSAKSMSLVLGRGQVISKKDEMRNLAAASVSGSDPHAFTKWRQANGRK